MSFPFMYLAYGVYTVLYMLSHYNTITTQCKSCHR